MPIMMLLLIIGSAIGGSHLIESGEMWYVRAFGWILLVPAILLWIEIMAGFSGFYPGS